MTLRLSRHQRLELCRLRSGHLLLLCWTLAPVRWPTKRVSVGWVKRIVWEWPHRCRWYLVGWTPPPPAPPGAHYHAWSGGSHTHPVTEQQRNEDA
jgi:hypothetical protein